MTAKRTDPHLVSVASEEKRIGRHTVLLYRWECTRGCVGRWTSDQTATARRGKTHQRKRIGRTTRG